MTKSEIHLIHHAAKWQHGHPPNSRRALEALLVASAWAFEVHISLLTGGRFALLQGPFLERQTAGSGPLSIHTIEQVCALHYIWQGEISNELWARPTRRAAWLC